MRVEAVLLLLLGTSRALYWGGGGDSGGFGWTGGRLAALRRTAELSLGAGRGAGLRPSLFNPSGLYGLQAMRRDAPKYPEYYNLLV